ncbi:GNAT family N-acetyltransferase [Rhodovibrio salinarum]|nr:GNAT family N-acetyltransferase [Rhodovibrio salinarum]
MTPITLAPFEVGHLDTALTLSQQVGWPHRIEDWELIRILSRGWVALEGAQVVGTAFLTPYGPTLGAANMIIVDERMRGRGVGRRLMDALLEAREGRTLQLVATEAGRPLYERLGFRPLVRIAQYQGTVGQVRAPGGVEPADQHDLSELVDLDHAASGGMRSALLSALIDQGPAAVIRRAGRIAAFGFRRPFGRGHVVGPIIASHIEDTQALTAHHLAACPGAFARIDVPEPTQMGSWLEETGLLHAGGGLMMRLPGHPLPSTEATVHALTSQALG